MNEKPPRARTWNVDYKQPWLDRGGTSAHRTLDHNASTVGRPSMNVNGPSLTLRRRRDQAQTRAGRTNHIHAPGAVRVRKPIGVRTPSERDDLDRLRAEPWQTNQPYRAAFKIADSDGVDVATLYRHRETALDLRCAIDLRWTLFDCRSSKTPGSATFDQMHRAHLIASWLLSDLTTRSPERSNSRSDEDREPPHVRTLTSPTHTPLMQPPQELPAESRQVRGCPRPESNQRTRFRKPLLYPLSYGGSLAQPSRLRGSAIGSL